MSELIPGKDLYIGQIDGGNGRRDPDNAPPPNQEIEAQIALFGACHGLTLTSSQLADKSPLVTFAFTKVPLLSTQNSVLFLGEKMLCVRVST